MPTDTRTCGEISCDECNDRYAAACKQLTQLRAERDEAVELANKLLTEGEYLFQYAANGGVRQHWVNVFNQSMLVLARLRAASQGVPSQEQPQESKP